MERKEEKMKVDVMVKGGSAGQTQLYQDSSEGFSKAQMTMTAVD